MHALWGRIEKYEGEKNIEIIYHTCRTHISSAYSYVMINLSITYPSSDKKKEFLLYRLQFLNILLSFCDSKHIVLCSWNIALSHKLHKFREFDMNLFHRMSTDRWNLEKRKTYRWKFIKIFFVWIV